MSELVKALRDAYEETDTVYFHLRTIIKDAADTIDRLTAENAEKQKLLDEWCSGEDHFQEVTEQLECAKSRNADLLQKTQQLETQIAELAAYAERLSGIQMKKYCDVVRENAKLTARLAAAVEDMKMIRNHSTPCHICKFDDMLACCHKNHCFESNEYFEWRGEESE